MNPRSLAHHLVVGLAGTDVTADEAAWISHHQPAGVILFARNCQDRGQLTGLCATLRRISPRLEIMADHEGGPVSQLARAIGRPPVPWALGAIDDLSLTARVHAETGRRLRSVGITRVLAPVVDVLTAVRNPVIGARAFGASARLVERHTVAAVTGLTGAGITVCLKHWPGHGGSLTDSHLADTTVGSGAIAAPFAAGLAAGADAIMVGHLRPNDEAALPATLDREHLAVTRRKLYGSGGVEPVLVADDVSMGGLRGAMAAQGIVPAGDIGTGMLDPAGLPLAWFGSLVAAGCDLLLVRGIPLGAFPLPDAAPRPATQTQAAVEGDFCEAAYEEARRRSWALPGAGFAAGEQDLLWWDLTVGDRWQVAGGDLGPTSSLLGPGLAGRFGRVLDWDGGEAASGSVSRLLVTSHRPLPDLGSRDLRLASEGVCLAMGHPSLKASLAGYLGPGWQVGAVFDVSPGDLFAVD